MRAIGMQCFFFGQGNRTDEEEAKSRKHIGMNGNVRKQQDRICAHNFTFSVESKRKKKRILYSVRQLCVSVCSIFFLSLLTLSFPCSMCQLKQVTWWLGRQITNGIHKERAEENAELTMNIKAAENLLAHQSLIKLHYMQHSSIFQTPTKVKKKTCWIVLKNSISKRIEFPVLILLLAFFLAFLQACALHGFNIVFLYFQMTSLYSVKQFWHFQDCRDQIELLMR